MSAARNPDPYPPLDKRAAAVTLAGGAVLIALCLTVVGWSIAHLAERSELVRWEDNLNEWFAAHRTPSMNTATHIGSYMAETITAIVLLVLTMAVLRLWLGRWRESITILVALAGELLIFLAVSTIVERPRPNPPHLDSAPPTSSFPSGHTSAAVAFYGCLGIILLRELRPRWVARLLGTLCFLVPVLVGLSRLYRGMHHPTDVVFGALGITAWLLLVISTLMPVGQSPPEVITLPRGSEEGRQPPGSGQLTESSDRSREVG
jgi:undecaprenyl-diphosphatase